MRTCCDLHVHSCASDGSLLPADVVRMAERKRLAGVALTDHDTVAGVAEARQAAAEFPSLTFIPGIELSAKFPQGTLHILGLCLDPDSASLAALIAQLRSARDERNPLMMAKLQALGIPVTMEDLLAEVAGRPALGTVVGRAHMASLLVRRGYARDMNDAFARYLGVDAPAYVDKERLTPAEVIAGIQKAGGLAILAHPVELQYTNYAECERLVRILAEAGLDGIEAYHSLHSDTDTRFFLDLARRLGLLVSGGSDFHGSAKQDVKMGRPRVPARVLEVLLARAAEKR